MKKINREEYEILKGLEDIWKWIARDNKGFNTKLKVHTSRPGKMIDSHWSSGDIMLQLLERKSLFQFVQWEDSEPWNIQGLIEEYEREEAEVKNIEWLKEEMSEILLTSKKDGTNYFYYRDLKEKIYNAIDQLDEPIEDPHNKQSDPWADYIPEESDPWAGYLPEELEELEE